MATLNGIQANIRAPVLTLSEALSEARKKAGKYVLYLNIYCDTLTIDAPLGPGPNARGVETEPFAIRIFARKLLATEDPKSTNLVVTMVPDCELHLMVQDTPASFGITFVVDGVPNRPVQYGLPSGTFGYRYTRKEDSKEVASKAIPPPDKELKPIDYLGMLADITKVKEQDFNNEYIQEFRRDSITNYK